MQFRRQPGGGSSIASSSRSPAPLRQSTLTPTRHHHSALRHTTTMPNLRQAAGLLGTSTLRERLTSPRAPSPSIRVQSPAPGSLFVSDGEDDMEREMPVEKPEQVGSAEVEVRQLRGQTYVIHNPSAHEEFLAWWRTTPYQDKTSHWMKGTRGGQGWEHYEQAAEKESGHPQLLCRRCGAAIRHPFWERKGTSGLKRHYDSEACKRGGPASKRSLPEAFVSAAHWSSCKWNLTV